MSVEQLVGFHRHGETFWMFSVRVHLGSVLLLNGTMHVLKKGRKRNEGHVERRHEGGVIHTRVVARERGRRTRTKEVER